MYISLIAAPPRGTKVFNKENQREAIPSTLTKTWRFFIRLIYDMTVIGSILMVWCDQLILLFVRTRLDWLFWQNDAGGWYHNRVGINLRYYLSNRLIRNWWQNTIQKWIWKGVSLTYFYPINWASAENVYFILAISITSPRTENPLAAEISLRVGDRFNQDVSHHLEGLSSFQFQNSKFQSNIKKWLWSLPITSNSQSVIFLLPLKMWNVVKNLDHEILITFKKTAIFSRDKVPL